MAEHRNRRDFLKQTAAAGVGFWVAGVAARADSKSANEKLNIAVVGCGGRGHGDLEGVSSENIVALCDVDEERARGAFNQFPNAKKYHDFRKMLEEQKDIDAVVVATPDHVHAPASVMAMKMGKHVYCEKPLTHTVYEARVMRETAAEKKVATQMGNQGTSESGLRRAVEAIRGGIIGGVHEVHVWTNRPIWSQGGEAVLKVAAARDAAYAALHGTSPTGSSSHYAKVPDTLKWDLWLGPAPERPYDPVYVPFAWRGWWDFGTGALGDMGCHTANMAFMALQLQYPTAIQAEAGPLEPRLNPETYPLWAKVRYEFPARGEMPPVKLHWYEGFKDSRRVLPDDKLFQGQKPSDSGCLLIGDKGTLFSPNDYGAECFVLHDKGKEKIEGGPEKLPVSPGHHREWIRACKGGPPAMSNFGYAGLLTETILLGNVAMRVGKRMEWDGENLKSPNSPEAAQYIRTEYRKGWTL